MDFMFSSVGKRWKGCFRDDMIRYEFLQDEMQQTYVLPNRTRPFSSMAIKKRRGAENYTQATKASSENSVERCKSWHKHSLVIDSTQKHGR